MTNNGQQDLCNKRKIAHCGVSVRATLVYISIGVISFQMPAASLIGRYQTAGIIILFISHACHWATDFGRTVLCRLQIWSHKKHILIIRDIYSRNVKGKKYHFRDFCKKSLKFRISA